MRPARSGNTLPIDTAERKNRVVRWDRSIVRRPVTTVAVTAAALAVASAGWLYGRAALDLVRHSEEEGGMNLDMPKDRITHLATRGMHAGRFLGRRFSGGESNPSDELSWDSHRWVRFRSLMPLIENLNANLVKGYRWPSSVGITSYVDGTVSRLEPSTGRVEAMISVGDGPNGLGAAAGSLWVANEFDGSITAIDPATDAVEQTVPV